MPTEQIRKQLTPNRHTKEVEHLPLVCDLLEQMPPDSLNFVMTRSNDYAADFVDAAISMEQALDEAGIFAALHAACEQMLGPTHLSGYVAALNRRTVRRAFSTGMADVPVDAIRDWLAGTDCPPPASPARPGGRKMVFHKLTGNNQTIGCFVLETANLEAGGKTVVDHLARLTSCNLSTLQRRKLSQLVLEALEQSEEAISFYDEEDGIVFSNPAYHRVFPYYPDRQGLLGARHLDLYKLDLEAGVIDDPLARTDPEAYLAERARLAKGLVDSHREIQPLGGRVYIYSRVKSKTGATMSRRIDVTEQWQATAQLRERERELKELVFRDTLTGLRNRAFLREHIAGITAAIEAGTVDGFGILLIDLNDFKAVNDGYGHDAGDQVLLAVAERISRTVGDQNVVARLGGDEFVVVLQNQTARPVLSSLARKLIATIAQPIETSARIFRMGASIGIAMSPGTGGAGVPDSGTRDVLVDADVAMYATKSQRPKTSDYAFFRPAMLDALTQRRNMVEALRTAVAEQTFELHYQPRFSTRTRELLGFEALLRWRDDQDRPVPPSRFIPLLEETGLIEQVGEWVLATACRQAQSWPSHLSIAVNVSPLQVCNPRFSMKIVETLAHTNLLPHRLELEITESVFLENEQIAIQRLTEWRNLGVRVALDDFGKGYSSLDYLSWVPVDIIKLDRTFIARFDPAAPDERVKAILRSVVDLGKALGMIVIAEGVEREDQMDLLNSIGCPQVQGFLLGRPLPLSALPLLLSKTG